MKNKIMFAGFMGAILMSVGAANAATTTTIATKGYVDSRVNTVQESVDTLETNAVTAQDVANAIDDKVTELNLGTTYEALANKVQAISSSMSAEDQATKYPSVKAVLDAMPTLTDEDKQAIADLTGPDGLITRVDTLETNVGTLTGTGDGSVAKSIADALSASQADWSQTDTNASNFIKNKPSDLVTTSALNTTLNDYAKTADLPTYQAKSTGDLQIGTTGGVFRDMTTAEKAALASGVTAEKVAAYDVLAGDGEGSVAALQTAVDGLNGADGTITQLTTIVGADADKGLQKKVADNTTNIATNADAIAANAEAIADKITMPAACASGNQTCVLMVSNGTVSWTPVTTPVDDPATTGGTTGE